MSRVVFKDVVKRINVNVNRHNTERLYYVGGEHIDSCELLVTKHGLIEGSTIGFKFHFGFEPGHILFMSRNPHLRKASMATFSGVCSDSTYVVETRDENVLLQKYLLLEMQSDRFWEWAEANKSGGVNYLINYKTLDTYEFDLPSLAEQKVLAEKLWAAYEVKQSYKRMIEATQQMVKSQFIEMFDGDKYHQMELDSIAEVWLKGQAFKKDNICEEGTNFCIHYGELFTKYGPIIYDVSSTTNDEIMKASKSGDILFPASDVTPDGLARCSAIMRDEVLLGGDIIVLRPKQGNNPEYLSWAINMQKEQLLKRVTGSVVRHMSAKGLKTVQIPIAPIDKQKQFIKIVKQADKSEFELRKSIDAIDKVIKSLINENL